MEFPEIKKDNREEVALLMATNHRYFVRTVVTAVVINALLFGVLLFANIALDIASMSVKLIKDREAIMATGVVISAIIYLIVLVVQLVGILSLHKKISAAEEHFVVDADVVR